MNNFILLIIANHPTFVCTLNHKKMNIKLARFTMLVAMLFSSVATYAQIFDSTAVGKVKVSGRVNMDGAYFTRQPDFVMSDGVTFSELRVRFSTILSSRTDFRAEIDFALGSVVPRDVAFRYFVDKNFTVTLGNFRESFSPAAYASSTENFFISVPTPGQAFGCSRNLGVAARYVVPPFFAEAGVFGQDLLDQIKGSKGYAFTNRVLYRPLNSGSHVLQFGFSNTIRRADANNLSKDASGKEIELRTVNYGSRAETNVDRNQLISVKNPFAKYQDKLSVEFLGIWQKLAVQGEYMNAFVKAKSGYDNQQYQGYYAQAIYQVRGKGIAYNDLDAVQAKSGLGSINVGIRYSYTDLNDSKGYLVNGIYTDLPNGKEANGSFNGGVVKGFSAAVSFYPLKNFILTMEYNWGKLSSITLPSGSFQMAQAQAIIQF